MTAQEQDPTMVENQSNTVSESPLLDEIIEYTQLTPQDEAYDLTMQGLQALVSQLITTESVGEKVNKTLLDEMIAQLDQKISIQLDEILHHPDFQKIESCGAP